MNTAGIIAKIADSENAITEIVTQDDRLTDEDRDRLTELRSERADLNTRLAAAAEVASKEVEKRTEAVEAVDARAPGLVSEILTAALEKRDTTGATKELQEELGLAPNQVPLALLTPLETRAVTPAPTTGEPTNTREPLAQIFPRSVSSYLTIAQETVASGEASYPVLTSTTRASMPAAGASVAETTGAFTANVLVPGRVQASFYWRREDQARFPMLESSLRENLSMALMDRIDEHALDTVLPSVPAGVGTATSWDGYAALLSDLVDGYRAYDFMEVRALCNPAVLGDMIATVRSGNAADVTSYDFLKRVLGGIRVSAHMPPTATRDSETGNADILFRRGMTRDAVCAIWDSVTLIPDEITKAATGEIVLTAVGLFACDVLRADGFVRKGVKLS